MKRRFGLKEVEISFALCVLRTPPYFHLDGMMVSQSCVNIPLASVATAEGVIETCVELKISHRIYMFISIYQTANTHHYSLFFFLNL